MSQYADSSKQRYEKSASRAKATAVTKGDNGNAGNDAEKPYKPPVWAKFVTWPEGVGAWAVILTLLAIAWQSVETRATAKATQASVEAMEMQNDAVRDKERASLSIHGVSKPEFQPAGSFLSDENAVPVVIRMFIINDGETRALNVEATGNLQIDSSSNKKFRPSGISLNIPRIIRVTGTENPIKVTVTGSGTIKGVMTGEFTMIPKELAEGVIEGTRFLRIGGAIEYEDIFGEHHSTPFDYLWEVPGNDGTARWIEGCRWLDESPRPT